MMNFRIGYGYDVHALEKGLPLWLGGIRIQHSHGLVGHSDADVLLHAICDALLGALALGDIGQHFPDTSNEFKGVDSKILLKQCYDLVRTEGYVIENIDSTVILELPRLRPHINEMRNTIANIMNTSLKNVSVKATTTERLGFAGRKEGIAAEAVVLLKGS